MRQTKPVAIIDIGSNSVRLVVYSGLGRAPHPIFNEKVLAGLGRCVGETGRISDESWSQAINVLKRFKILLRHMGIRQAHVVATAAARDASNGSEFVAEIEELGFECRVISAEEEAWLAGEGVLSAIPDADGIVADLGGGSVELVEVADGMAGQGISLPLGVLRLRSDAAGEKQAAHVLRAAIGNSRLAERGAGRPLYLVGGSWRALAKVDMIATDYPLPATHAYTFAPERVALLRRLLAQPDLAWAKKISAARLATTPVAAMLLEHLSGLLRPSRLVISSFGIREGLLYSKLRHSERRMDPLIEAAREAGAAERRFGEHGKLLDDWISPLFDDPPAARRIRLAACLLADVAWQASPDFRADRALEMALHGNWIAITAAERIMLAQALSSSFGRDKLPDQRLIGLVTEDASRRARQWGQAMRLGQRLSAGVGSILKHSRFEVGIGDVRMVLSRREAALMSDQVLKRVERLGEVLGKTVDVTLE
jgi:exopolyphosphatase/guanosine-5'-triphosphate,3'-diphosphate pyrophosphatase